MAQSHDEAEEVFAENLEVSTGGGLHVQGDVNG